MRGSKNILKDLHAKEVEGWQCTGRIRRFENEAFFCERSTITGVTRSQETSSSSDPTVGLCLGPFSSHMGEAVPYERGTPVRPRHIESSGVD